MINADKDWALRLYELFARGGDDESLYYLEISGDPWSKSRPRFARGRAYQPRDDLRAEQRLRSRLQSGGAPMFPGNVMMACRFYRASFQRIDTDNLLKHVGDAANGVLWKDDSQVTLVLGDLQLDPGNPRTILLVGNHFSTLARGADALLICPQCDREYLPPNGRRRNEQKHCSAVCSREARRVRLEPIECPQCHQVFQPRATRQLLCSRRCSGESRVGVKRPSGIPRSRCEDCGKELRHSRGGRCRDCWRADPKMMKPVVS